MLNIINIYNNRCDGLSFNVAVEIFDKTILPILIYGAEIWGCKHHTVIEKVQMKFLKRQLSLSQTTSDVAVIGETGRLPIAFHYHLKWFTFWLKLKDILDMADDRYPKRCYLMLKDHDLHDRRNWITDFKNMLRKFGCEHIWEKENSTKEQNEQYINSFKQGMIKFHESEWKHKLRNSSKLAIYASFKSDMRKENYIEILTLRKFLGILARFRTPNHTLEIELGRHKGLLLSQRICVYCDFHGDIHILRMNSILYSCALCIMNSEKISVNVYSWVAWI